MRNKTLSLLHKMNEVTMMSLETEAMVQEIVTMLDKEFSYPFVALAMCGPKGNHLHWKSFASVNKALEKTFAVDTLEKVSLASRTNACALALRHGRKHIAQHLSDVFALELSKHEEEVLSLSVGMKNVLVFPLALREDSVGILAVGIDRAEKDLTHYEKETFQSLLGLITIAIQKAETYGHLQRTTKQLKSANHTLRQLDSLKTEFLSIASHQLRTPLAVLKVYIGMFTGKMLGDLQPKQMETLKKMDSGTEQLIMLVNHLLDVSRIESQRLVVRLEPGDLRLVLDGLVKFLEGKAQEKGLFLKYIQPEQPMMANVDAEKIKEVFMNLLDNALKYTEKGGVEVKMTCDGTMIHVAIVDTGHGLTPKDMEHLFEKFVTGSASVTVRTTTGLGLYVCRKLCEAMGGGVIAESEGAEKGSVFTASFPLVKREGV